MIQSNVIYKKYSTHKENNSCLLQYIAITIKNEKVFISYTWI